MRRGELPVFMTPADEGQFLAYWRTKGLVAISSRVMKGKRPRQFMTVPPRSEKDGMLLLIRPDKKPRIRTLNHNPKNGFQLIDLAQSDVISYWRGAIHRGCIGMGWLKIDTWCPSIKTGKYLDETWKELKKWLKKHYFALPGSEGFLGADAMNLAVKKRRVIAWHAFLVTRARDGKIRWKLDPKYNE